MTDSTKLIFAFFLDLAIGDPKWLPHPVRIMGKAITRLEDFLRYRIRNAENRLQNETIMSYSDTKDNENNPPSPPFSKGGKGGLSGEEIKERWVGTLLVVIVAGSTYGLFYIINSMLLTFHFPLLTFYFSLLVMVYLISTTLATKGLIDSACRVIEALKDRSIEGARKNLRHIVGRDTDSLDEKGMLRATIESLAENASDGIIAPLFYFAIGGLPLAMTYKAINTMDSMVGYKNEKYRYFGWAAARLDDIANYIPARITGILIVISSAIVSCSLLTAHRSLKTMFRDGRSHPSPNSGVPEAAMAGALGIRLGGPSTYGGIVVNKPCIGEDMVDVYFSASEKAISIVKLTSVLGLGIAVIFQYVRTTL